MFHKNEGYEFWNIPDVKHGRLMMRLILIENGYD